MEKGCLSSTSPAAHPTQSSGVKVTTRRKERLITVADPCDGMNREVVAPSRRGHWPMRPSKGMNGAPPSASDV